jgi:hypothetical protein
MSSHSRKRAQRRSEFKSRKEASPTDVYVVNDRGWEYITVHPMADEAALLSSLGMKPTDCTTVDCYWATKRDVVFLQIATRGASHFEPGLYARRVAEPPNMTYLLAVVDAAFISRATVENVMARFADAGAHGRRARSLPTGGYRNILGVGGSRA